MPTATTAVDPATIIFLVVLAIAAVMWFAWRLLVDDDKNESDEFCDDKTENWRVPSE